MGQPLPRSNTTPTIATTTATSTVASGSHKAAEPSNNRYLNRPAVGEQWANSETPAFCFQEAFERRAGRSKMPTNIWNFRGVWFQPLLRHHCAAAALCSGNQERVGHGLTGHLRLGRDQLGEMRYGENLPDEFRLCSRWYFENSRIFFGPRDHIRFRAGLKLAPYLANGIRERRHDLEMSQHALAKALGITFQQIQKYENGTNRISAARLFEICKALKVPLSSMFPKE